LLSAAASLFFVAKANFALSHTIVLIYQLHASPKFTIMKKSFYPLAAVLCIILFSLNACKKTDLLEKGGRPNRLKTDLPTMKW
jgi:hypothetical protein